MNKYTKKNEETERKIKDSAMQIYAEGRDRRFSVTEICARAGINRCTFYLHYASAEELLERIKDELLTGMQERSMRLRLHNIYDVQHDRSRSEDAALVEVMRFCAQRREPLTALLSPEGDPGFREDVRQMIAGLFYASFYLYDQTFGREQDYAIRFITSGLVDNLYHWLVRQDRTPEEMSAFCMHMSELVPVIQMRRRPGVSR